MATSTIAAGLKPRRAALEVEELLATQVEGEAGLGHGVIGHRQGHAGGQDRVAAMGNVGEWSAVHERRRRLGRLDQVGHQGLVQDRGHRAGHADRLGQHGLTARRVADEDSVQPGPQIGRRVGQAEDGHDFTGGRDIEARLARDSLRAASQADHDVPQRPVVHVEGALPEDARRIEVDVAEMEPVVDRGGEQVVGRRDRVEVAGELEVDGVRRLDPAGAAAGGAPLAAEDGPHRRLAQAPAPRGLPIRHSPWARPIDVVVFPSPAGVGVIAETRINLPAGRSCLGRRAARPAGPWPCLGRKARGARARSSGRGPAP